MEKSVDIFTRTIMNKELRKKKNDLMKSIMSNPKLSKTFRDAMAAPIGSTKREQAKSVLSIMRKIGGFHDGQGGPEMPSSTQPSIPEPTNYGNMMIFPPAPKFKTKVITEPEQPKVNKFDGQKSFSSIQDGQGGLLDDLGQTFSPFITPFKDLLNSTKTPTPTSTVQPPTTSTNQSTLNMSVAPTQNMSMVPPNMSIAPKTTTTTPNLTTPEGVKALQTQLNAQYTGQPGWTPLVVDGILGPKTKAAQSFTPTPVPLGPVLPSNFKNITNTLSSGASADRSIPGQSGYQPLGSYNIAATNIARFLGLSPTTPLAQVPVMDLANAIATNEGYFNGTSGPALANNNPGNLKFVGQPGAVQGSKAADGGYFAKFATPQAGAQALINDLTIKYNSGKYQTINDLMTVYSPDSGAPSSGLAGGTPGSALKTSAQAAVDEGTGPGLFALNIANEKFGGGLDQYIANLDAKLKQDFNLEPLEQQLSDLKAERNSLIPTLTQYIQGKDKYLKFIDKLIDSTEDELLDQDMGNPAVSNAYNNYLNYLYTLKGRQTQRYGNYLNSAISEYNAEVEQTQNNYNNVYQRYSDAITRQGTIAQNEYNTLYTTMADLYTNLEQAPIKAANLEALRIQNLANNQTILQNGLNGSVTTINPDYWKDITEYTKQITVDDGDLKGTLDLNKVPANGLIGLYAQNYLQGGDEIAMTEAIRRALAQTLTKNTDPATFSTVKKLISDLAADPNGAPFAETLSAAIIPAAKTTLSTYILSNMASVKDAVKDLVSSYGGFLGIGSNEPGLNNKAQWKKDHSNLGSEFLDALYETVSNNILPGTSFAENPSAIIGQLLPGKTDQENAEHLAGIIAISS